MKFLRHPLLGLLGALAACSSTPSPSDAGSSDVVAPTDSSVPTDALTQPDALTPTDSSVPTDALTQPDVIAPADALAQPDVVAPADVVTPMDAPAPADVAQPDALSPADVIAQPDVPIVPRCGTTGSPSWAIENPLPVDQAFTSIFAAAPGDIYLATGNGTAARRWNGTAFEPFGGATGVWGASASDIIATDAMGVRRGAGSAFTATALGGAFRAVHGTSAANVYAVGVGGLARRWNGTTWETLSTGITAELSVVFAAAPNDVWVGSRAGGEGTATPLLRYNGTTWQTFTPMALFGTSFVTAPTAIWGSSPNDVYFCFPERPVLHWNGTAFQTRFMTELPGGCSGVSGTSATDVWFVGRTPSDGYVHRFNGTAVTHPWPMSSRHLQSVHAASPTLVAFGGQGGTFATFDGTSYTERSGGYRENIGRVWVAPTGEVFAQGPEGIYLGECGRWTKAAGAPGDRGDVHGTDATHVWFGGTGGVRRINGTPSTVGALEPYGIGDATDITYGVFAASPTAVFTAGATRNTEGMPSRNWVRAWNGSAWRDITPTGTFETRRVTGFGPTEVFVRGGNGQVLRFNGTTWTPESIGVTDYIQDLIALPGNVLIAMTGNARNSRRRSPAGVWSSAGWGTGSSLSFQRAWGRAENDVYATRYSGSGTYLWHWNGTAWSEVSILSDYLDDVAGNGFGDVTAVGNVGRIWRYGRRAP